MDASTKAFNRRIGKRLRDARLLRGLSQEKLGEIVGISFQQIQKYEKGTNGLSPTRMKQFAKSVGVTIGYFYGTADVEMPHVSASHRKLLILMQALKQLEKQQPAAFLKLFEFIVLLARAAKQDAGAPRK
jgi:transcriptional regulator with XRE-family HTH domain